MTNKELKEKRIFDYVVGFSMTILVITIIVVRLITNGTL